MKTPLENNRIPVRTNWAAVVLFLGIGLLALAAICVAVSWIGALATSDSDVSNDVEGMITSTVFAGFVLPLVILGGLLTILGLVFRKPSIRQQNAVQACPDCGRENALTTSVCPRCGARLGEATSS